MRHAAVRSPPPPTGRANPHTGPGLTVKRRKQGRTNPVLRRAAVPSLADWAPAQPNLTDLDPISTRVHPKRQAIHRMRKTVAAEKKGRTLVWLEPSSTSQLCGPF